MNIQEQKQKWFNKAYLGLKNQDFKRSVYGTSCRYRGPKELKCAIGHLIPDDKYAFVMENRGPADLTVYSRIEDVPRNLDGTFLSFQDLSQFLHRLQNCHDLAIIASEVKENLLHFAKVEKLTIPEET